MVSFNNCENIRVLCVRCKMKKWSSYQREKIMQTTKSMMHGFKDTFDVEIQIVKQKIVKLRGKNPELKIWLDLHIRWATLSLYFNSTEFSL